MCREPPTVLGAARGDVTAAHRRRSRSCSSSVSARSKISAGSPDGMAGRAERLYAAKLLLRLARDRELQFVAVRRQGSHYRSRRDPDRRRGHWLARCRAHWRGCDGVRIQQDLSVGQLPDRRRNGRQGTKRCNEFLDLPLPLVACQREHVLMICRRQVRRQQPDGGQRYGPLIERREDCGEAACRAGSLDAVIGGTLGEVQRVRAVGEQRRVALAQVEPAHVELHQRAHESRSSAAFRRRQTLARWRGAHHRRGVRTIESVTSCALLSRRFSAPQDAASHAIGAERSRRVAGAPVAWSIGQRRRPTRYPSQGLDDAEGLLKTCQELFQLVPERVERSRMRLSWQSAAS